MSDGVFRRALTRNALALVFACLVPGASIAAEVEVFSPEGSVKGVRQVLVRFSTPMVTFGDPRLEDPALADCPVAGSGRWADQRNWVYDFEEDLPGGLACAFTLTEGLTDLEGAPIMGPREFSFDTGGPAILGADPDDGSWYIEEEQTFVLVFDAPVDLASFEEKVFCESEALEERIPMSALTGERAEAVLDHWLTDDQNYLWIAHPADAWSRTASDDPAHLAHIRERLVVAQCQRALPPSKRAYIVIGEGLETPDGLLSQAERTLGFRVRDEFLPSFRCLRVNAEADCAPVSDMRLVLGAEVPRELALGITLVAETGEVYRAVDPGGESEAPVISSVEFKGPFPEQTGFTINLPDGFTDETGRAPSNIERFPLEVRTDEFPPLVKFPGAFGIIEAEQDGILPVSLRNVENEVTGRVLRLNSDGSGFLNWMNRVQAVERDRGMNSLLDAEESAQALAVPKAEGDKAFEVVGIPLEEPGFYVVELASPRLGEALLALEQPRYVATAALITDMAVHFQWGTAGSAVWVTDLEDGEPVEGAEVVIHDACDGDTFWSGSTDENGLARIGADDLPAARDWGACYEWSESPLIAIARKDGDMSFTLSTWDSGLEPYEFGFQTGGEWERDEVHTVFDRPLFRAGETVSMKHYARRKIMEGFGLPQLAGEPAAVNISHSGSGDRYSFDLDFDGAGVAESSWDIPQDAKLGSYSVSVEIGDDWFYTGEFLVEEFRLPTLAADIEAGGSPAVGGEPVTLDLFVSYLSGGGAAGLDVRLRTLVEERRLSFDAYDQFVFGGEAIVEGTEPVDYYGYYNEPGEAGDNVTPSVTDLSLDDEGAARVTINDYRALSSASRLVAELEYQDANGEILSTYRTVDLWPAGVALGIKREGWASNSGELSFQVLALDPSGQPIEDQQVSAELFTQEIYSYRKRLVGGFYAYENLRTVTKLEETCEGETGRDGIYVCEMEPEVSGEVLIRVSARDEAGNESFATTSVWMVGEDSWWFAASNSDRMDLLPEKPEYDVGDTARFQVRMPFREATALVSVLREGVMESFVTELSGNEPVIEVPITDAFSPNVYVSVLAVRGRVGSIRSELAELARDWDLPWVSRDGGVPTGTVDLSKPAYRLGMAEIKVGWSPHRLNVQVEPEAETFGVREEAEVTVRVTPALGGELPEGAEIAVAVVDEGLLQLRANTSWDLLTPFMGERGIEVYTSTAQMQVVGKRHYGRKALPEGGGGGRLDSRELFDTLLLWEGRLPLEADGTASFTVPLNDSLTAFRIVAVASAGLELFGTGTATINTTQDLMLFSGLPPVVREGDRFDAIFTLRNASDAPLEVDYSASVAEAPALSFEGTESLLPGQAREIVLPAETPLDHDSLTWTLTATSTAGEPLDAITVTQEVKQAIPVRVYQATIAQLTDRLSLVAGLPDGAIEGRGGMHVTLQSSLAGEQDALIDYMTRYPFTCFEQQTSKAIALSNEDAWNRLIATAPSYIDDNNLLRYYPHWRLRGSAVLTAYVLSVAHEAGWSIPANTQSRLIFGLKAFVEGRTEGDPFGRADTTMRKLAALAALARHGEASYGLASNVAYDPALWPTSAVLDWIDVLKYSDLYENQEELLEEAKAIIRARLNFQGTTMGFSTEDSDYLWWLMVSGDYNAVRALGVLADDPAWAEDIPRMLRGALGRQLRGRWSTTTANAWGVLALERYRAVFESDAVSGVTSAVFGETEEEIVWRAEGDGVESHKVDFAWGQMPQTLTVDHAAEMDVATPQSSEQPEIVSGAPWAVIQSRAALPLTEPLSSGYAITRTITPVEQQNEGQWTEGDVLRISLEIDAQSDMSWVVVEDPLPAGASALGSGLGGDSRLLASQEDRNNRAWLAFEERRFDVFRAYYRYVPKGSFSLDYTIRLNNPGVFLLPATRVEAMYAPEMFGELPNETIEVMAQ